VKNTLIKITGKIDFLPVNKTKKHQKQSSWKKTAMIKTYCDLEKYYAWFIEKRFNLKLNQTIRGTHVSFINDRFPDEKLWNDYSKIFHNKEITFYYDPAVHTNGKHWWLRIFSPDAESVRSAIGLDPEPHYAMHLSLGYANDKNLDHSEYILRQIKRFDLFEYEARKKFENYKILENEQIS